MNVLHSRRSILPGWPKLRPKSQQHRCLGRAFPVSTGKETDGVGKHGSLEDRPYKLLCGSDSPLQGTDPAQFWPGQVHDATDYMALSGNKYDDHFSVPIRCLCLELIYRYPEWRPTE